MKTFKKLGWQVSRQRGSHIILTKQGHVATLSIPISEDNGCSTLSSRVALGALLIKERLGASDRETVEQICENPYLQYFLGMKEYQAKPLRVRITPFLHVKLQHF